MRTPENRSFPPAAVKAAKLAETIDPYAQAQKVLDQITRHRTDTLVAGTQIQEEELSLEEFEKITKISHDELSVLLPPEILSNMFPLYHK